MGKVPVNKILPFSLVDGPGCRCAVFLQGCNIRCAYCHNPETQMLCDGCGLCVKECPGKALELSGKRVLWKKELCLNCDHCIEVCPKNSSPKIVWMDAEEVFLEIRKSMPFIRGVSVSGGECMLYPEFLKELFFLCREAGLNCLIDSNGTYPFDKELLSVCDGVMLDVKAWDRHVFEGLCGGGNEMVLENLRVLADIGKLEEIRVVCLEPYVDVERIIRGISGYLAKKDKNEILVKLIRFRPFGVRGELIKCTAPGMEYMGRLEKLARECGLGNVKII